MDEGPVLVRLARLAMLLVMRVALLPPTTVHLCKIEEDVVPAEEVPEELLGPDIPEILGHVHPWNVFSPMLVVDASFVGIL